MRISDWSSDVCSSDLRDSCELLRKVAARRWICSPLRHHSAIGPQVPAPAERRGRAGRWEARLVKGFGGLVKDSPERCRLSRDAGLAARGRAAMRCGGGKAMLYYYCNTASLRLDSPREARNSRNRMASMATRMNEISPADMREIGSASWRERGCQDG